MFTDKVYKCLKNQDDRQVAAQIPRDTRYGHAREHYNTMFLYEMAQCKRSICFQQRMLLGKSTRMPHILCHTERHDERED